MKQTLGNNAQIAKKCLMLSIQIIDTLQDYKKTIRFDYTITLQIEYMTNIPKILTVDDFIEGELEYDDDGIYYGE